MSIPPKLAAVADDPQFWTSYLWEDAREVRFPGCKLKLPVSKDQALVLEIVRDIDAVRLLLPDGAELAVDSPAGGCPDVLRWAELEIVCRALALRHPALAHPGLPLRLLARFAPICAGDDVAAIAPMLVAAWRAAGAADRVVRSRIERVDRRADGFVWVDAGGCWGLEQQPPAGCEPVGRAYGPRFSGNPAFPHGALRAVIDAAAATVAGAVEPAWRSGAPGQRARAAVQAGDLGAGDEIAALLTRAGCRVDGLLHALTGAAAARAWALEVLLGEPAGRLVGHFLGREVPVLRPRARLTLELPAAAPVGAVVDRLSGALRGADLGEATPGAAQLSRTPDGGFAIGASSVSVVIRGDLEAAIALIRATLAPAPVGAVLRVDAPVPRVVPL